MSVQTEISLNVSDYIKPLQATVKATADATKFIIDSFNKVKTSMDLKAPKVDTSSIQASATQIQKSLETAAKTAAESYTNQGKIAGDNFGKGLLPEIDKTNAEIKKSFTGGLKDAFKDGQQQAASGGGVFGALAGSLGQLASPIGLATAAIGGLTAGIAATVQIGREFETSLAAVGAITGQSGEDLQVLGDNARDLAKKFGGDAVTQLASFQGVLSRFGADLAKSPEQLKTLADNINVLGKAGGLDAAQSMDALTNSMLQFGVDVANPNEAAQESTRFINALAKSAEVGAAEIPQVTDAILVAGVAAKKANVSFEETNAAIQVLAAGGKVGAEAGTALRNVLGKIAGEEVIPKEALDKLKSLGVDMNKVSDTSKPLSERLKELGKASKDATAFAQVFGSENAAAASILADGAVTIKDWTKEITGSNAAFDQAATNMDTFSERISRAQAQIEDVAIGAWQSLSPTINAAFDVISTVVIGAVKGWYAYIEEGFVKPLQSVWDTIIESLSPLKDLFLELFGGASKEGINFVEIMQTIGKVVGFVVNVALIPLKLAFQGVGYVIKGVIAVVQLIKKNFEQAYDSSALFRNIINGIANAFKSVVGWIGDAIDYLANFFSALEKKPEAPFKEVQKSAETTSEAVGELNEELSKDTEVPNTSKTKKEYTDLTEYILSLKDKITDISFQVGIAEQDNVIKTLEKQIKEISVNPNLTQVAKLNLSIELETQKAISESEKELESLANANKKAIEAIEKDFETKKKGAKKSDIEKAEKIKNELIEAETLRFYDAALKIVNEREAKLVDIKTVNGDKIIDYTKKQNEVLRQLQIENISDERERNYQKELLALETKFDTEYDLYKDNKDILLQLEQKFITDYQNLNEKFATKDIDTTNDLLKANLNYVSEFNKSIASIQLTDNSGRLEGIKQESRDLKKALENNEITYETYVEKIVELENEKLALQKKTNSAGIALIINTSKVFLDNLVTQVTAYADYAQRKKAIDIEIAKQKKALDEESTQDMKKQAEIQRSISLLVQKQENDNLATLGNVLAESKSLFAENTLAYKLMAIAQASISTYLAAANQLAMVPVTPFNIVLASLITAAGLANVAKIAGFKKGGYTGDGGTNDTVGVVHGREFVAHATATKTYRDVLERINKNELSNVFIGANGKIIDGANVGIVHNNITRNDSPRVNTYNRELKRSMDRLSYDIRNNTTNKHTQFGVEIESKLKMRGDNIENGLTKIKRKKLQRG